ncbi:MAG: Uma2 family endonuclease [Caldilineaceae bacterium]|nr:Uma2 family endonuclease [Caldilineaceae bacterium]MDE0339054.1 Uma2 family endonuclease [Caldilineaceae bacterium]
MQSIKAPRDAPLQQTAPSKGNRYAPDHGRRVSKEEYWARWYENPYPDIDVSYEWNNGILEAKPFPNYPQIRQYGWFYTLLNCYIQSHPIAKLINLETGVSMTVLDAGEPSGKWEVVYKPDIGVVLNDNPAPWGAVELRAFEGVCDMIVEEASDSTLAEVRRDTEEKRRGYALAGVKEYFILDPADRYMRFYRLTADRRYAQIRPGAGGVIRSQVLPGFQFRRRDLLDLPDMADLALDELYAGYVIPGFLDSMNRAEAEAAARRQAEERAEEAEESAAAEAVARRQAEESAAVEAAARRQAEEQMQALKAELARLRQDRS